MANTKIAFELTPEKNIPQLTLEQLVRDRGGIQFLELSTVDKDLPDYYGEPRVMIAFRIEGKINSIVLDKDGIVVNRGGLKDNYVSHVEYKFVKDIEKVIFQN